MLRLPIEMRPVMYHPYRTVFVRQVFFECNCRMGEDALIEAYNRFHQECATQLKTIPDNHDAYEFTMKGKRIIIGFSDFNIAFGFSCEPR